MRIAIVGTELCAVDARGGGLEQVLRRWAATLAERHDVVVVSHRPGGRELDLEPGPYRTIGISRTAELAGVLAGIAPDVVSLHNRPQWAGLSTRAAVTFHNYPTAWKLRARDVLAPATYSAVSGALAAVAAEHLGREVALTPPPIHEAYCGPTNRRPEPVVLFPNRLMRKKGVLDLLEVAARPEAADLRFEFADLISPWLRPTAEHRALRAAVRAVDNAALFAPTGDASALAARYATAAVVACPVREPEGLGLVPLEAQACAAPVVTTDLGGLREATFAPNACIAAGDPDALASAVFDAARRSAPSVGARDNVLARHSPEASAAVYERWLTDL